MKKLILLELAFLFLATTFSSNPPPPGWYQQTLPVNDYVNDIFFLDSLNGWVATNSDGSSNDSAYIMKTTDGGNNWIIQERNRYYYSTIQFLDLNYGYLCGSTGAALIWKTSNGGSNWFEVHNFGLAFAIEDMDFINKDTGWVSSSDLFFGGLWKTTNGGQNWSRQLDQTYKPFKIFFINKDTGWMGNTHQGQLYKTLNGGMNWNIQYSFSFGSTFKDILFINKDSGWISLGTNEIQFSSNGGSNWTTQLLPPKGGMLLTSRSERFSTIDGKTIWTVGGNLFYGMGRFRGIIYKSTNSGNNWYYQIPDTSINIAIYKNIQFTSDSAGWASFGGIIHTQDGGGPLVNINNTNSEITKNYVLHQNYPNPFNPKTIINYELRKPGYIRLQVFDISGKEVEELVRQKQTAGEYKIEFNGSNLASGVYLYKLEVSGEKENEVFSETKKMILIR